MYSIVILLGNVLVEKDLGLPKNYTKKTAEFTKILHEEQFRNNLKWEFLCLCFSDN